MPKIKRRSKIQIERDRAIISQLYLNGLTQSQIAEKLGMNQSTVSRDLKEIRKQWMKDTAINIDKEKLKDLAMIDKMLDELWEAWEYSRKYQVVKSKGVTTLIPNDTKNPMGDHRYMSEIDKCIKNRRAIVGTDAPIRHDHGLPITDINVTFGKKKK